ncbi:nitric oxide synthase, salivary gland-like [Ctenocephalides felis]|uniref:nitric oxide synthase, salivary gland-like n=1 Tax=Ctenocephalides felis TaxID=7515 RepID=UPI000E6E43A3|nr:nitric oxide synthase, salivary gland-like [Ctenocephalides felis]
MFEIVACETFCLEDTDTYLEATQALNTDVLSQDTIRFVESVPEGLIPALRRCYNKKVVSCKLLRQTNLHKSAGEGSTLLLEIEIPKNSKDELKYEPGDHIGVFPENSSEIVNGLLERLEGAESPDSPVELQVLKETQTHNGVVRSWSGHERLPRCSLRMLLTRFLDLTTPPSPAILQYLSSCCTEEIDKDKLESLASDSAAYEDWRHLKYPHLLEVLEQFPSCRPSAKMLCAQLSPLQARFYSVSSAPEPHPGQIHLTVAVVQYKTQNGEGPLHYGVCSNYLKRLTSGKEIAIFVRSAPSFHLPIDSGRPIVLIGPGTGVAPFRGFWHSLHHKYKTEGVAIPKLWLFFGCRQRALDLYREEKNLMLEEKIIDREFLALSRQPGLKKTYVQDLVLSVADDMRRILVHEHGHLYVCGDVTMAECVHQAVRTALTKQDSIPKETIDRFLLDMRDENRYHEDIFGITLRTAEVHNRSRATARIRLEKQN